MLCKNYFKWQESGRIARKNSHKGPKGQSQNHDLVICKAEPPDSDEFGKTLKALNDNLTNDNELMSSLIWKPKQVLLVKYWQSWKMHQWPKVGVVGGRVHQDAKQIQGALKSQRTTQNHLPKRRKEPAKKEDKKPATTKKIKKEPVEYKDDIEDANEINNDVMDEDDVDNDPDFNDIDDEDIDETYDPSGGNSESPRGRKRRLSRNIRTGKVLRSAKKLKSKPRERKEPKEKRKEKRGRVNAIDLLKEKLEVMNGEEASRSGNKGNWNKNELVG